jgi:hypothetical protein
LLHLIPKPGERFRFLVACIHDEIPSAAAAGEKGRGWGVLQRPKHQVFIRISPQRDDRGEATGVHPLATMGEPFVVATARANPTGLDGVGIETGPLEPEPVRLDQIEAPSRSG